MLVVSSGSTGSAFLNNHTVSGGAILHYAYALPALKITTIPEQHMVQAFPAHGADQALDERLRERHVGQRFDFVDLQNP
jgi:hypothetical protein